MQIGLSTLSRIGTNYFIPLNDKKLLIVEDDPRFKEEDGVKKLQAEEEKKTKAEQKNKIPKSSLKMKNDLLKICKHETVK